MPVAERNCLSHEIAIQRAKNELKELVGSPNTRLVNEYTSLVQKEYAAIEQFVYNNKIPHEDAGELYDAMKTKYGIDPIPSSAATSVTRCMLLLKQEGD